MKNAILFIGIVLAYMLSGCHEDTMEISGEYGAPNLYNLSGREVLSREASFIVPSDGATFHFQDVIGFLNWKWAFYDGKVKIDEGKAVFDSVLNLGEGLTLGFEAKDETATNVQTIFEDDIEKPYRYFDITILPNQSIKVREFTIELTPVPDRNYAVFPTRIKFTQHAGVETGE